MTKRDNITIIITDVETGKVLHKERLVEIKEDGNVANTRAMIGINAWLRKNNHRMVFFYISPVTFEIEISVRKLNKDV